MSNRAAPNEAHVTTLDEIVPDARILVVDDDPPIRELHVRVLSLAGYEVETAEDGVAALERLAVGAKQRSMRLAKPYS